MIYTIVGIAGAIGAFLRYGIGIIIPSTYYMGFPVSTLVINCTGCFFLSWFLTWITTKKNFPVWANTGITTGLIGSFTTFSTFQLDLVQLVEANKWMFAFLYFFLSIFGGYYLTYIGQKVAPKKEGNF